MEEIRPVKAAVVGVGYLGKFHAEKLALMKQAELVAVVDNNPEQAEKVAAKFGVPWYTDHTRVIDQVQAVSVVTPTIYHHKVALDFLKAGKDVICEKPMTTTLEEADELVRVAKENDLILQVGHLERFNPAVEELFDRVHKPLFIECNRIAPFKARATDVDVALDLMIHDLDIILALVGEIPSEIRAVGVPVLGKHADIVNTRIEFPGGCVANVTASRLALKDERKMRVFQPDSYVHLDFKSRKLLAVNGVEYKPGKKPKVKADRPRFGKADPLDKELKSFIDCVSKRVQPRVSGESGRRALACALAVQKCMPTDRPEIEALIESSRKWVGTGSEGEE
jgi:predicted dehydrogenase